MAARAVSVASDGTGIEAARIVALGSETVHRPPAQMTCSATPATSVTSRKTATDGVPSGATSITIGQGGDPVLIENHTWFSGWWTPPVTECDGLS